MAKNMKLLTLSVLARVHILRKHA